MKTKNLLTFFLLLLPILTMNSMPVSSQGAQPEPPGLPQGEFVARIYLEDPQDIQLLSAYDVFEFRHPTEGYVLAAMDAAGFLRLQALGLKVEVDLVETANLTKRAAVYPDQVQGIPGYSCYRTVEETFQTAQDLVNTYPSLATWIDVGDSWEKSVGQPDGYDLQVLKLTNASQPGSLPDGAKPKLFITASIHAREYTPAELATRFAEVLLHNYGVEADATWLIDHHEIHLMLQANPDGRKEAEAGIYWRKNTNENYCGVTSLYRGADLNRNFDYMWGGVGASTNPCDILYRGASAASEPETQAIQNYLLANFPDQRQEGAAAPDDATGLYIDLHSYGELVLWPWGYTTTLAPNGAALQTLGRKLADYNHYYAGPSGADLYLTSGDTIDYAYGQLGLAAYTVELGTAFFQSCAAFEETILPDNLPALIYAAKAARTPYLTALGPEALDLHVDPAQVAQGTLTSLTAVIDDTRYSSPEEPVQQIAAAEYYLDTPPWLGGMAHPMAASDGSLNAVVEAFSAAVDTSSLSPGKHLIFVRGQDVNGNWGAVSAVFLTVSAPPSDWQFFLPAVLRP